MITTSKKVLLSIDVFIQVVFLGFLIYSYTFIPTDQTGAILITLGFSGLYNPIATILHLLIKNPNKKIVIARIVYLIAIPIYVLFFIIIYVTTDPNQQGFWSEYGNLIVLNIFAWAYALITFFAFVDMREKSKTKVPS